MVSNSPRISKPKDDVDDFNSSIPWNVLPTCSIPVIMNGHSSEGKNRVVDDVDVVEEDDNSNKFDFFEPHKTLAVLICNVNGVPQGIKEKSD